MKQSKIGNQRVYLLLLYIAISISYIILYKFGIINLSSDAEDCYAKSISTEYVTDWHSSLYLYEMIIVKRILTYVGVCLPATTLVGISGILAAFISWGNMLLWIERLGKTKQIYYALIIPAIVLFFITNMHIGMDQFFLAPLFTIITLINFYPNQPKNNILLYILTSSIAIIQMLTFRRNAIFLCPFLIFAMLSSQTKFHTFFRLILSLFLTIACYFCATDAISRIFPVIHTHPTVPMLVSQMRTAEILNGSIGNGHNPYADSQGKWIGVTCMMATSVFPEATALGCKGKQLDEEKQHWANIVNLYIEAYEHKTQAMLAAHLIHYFQFFTFYYTPKSFRNLIYTYYPNISPESKAWTNGNIKENKIVYRCFIRTAPLLTILYLIYISIKRRHNQLSKKEQLFFNFSIISILYILSYFPFTPSPNFRYINASFILSCYVIFCILLDAVSRLYNTYFKITNEAEK